MGVEEMWELAEELEELAGELERALAQREVRRRGAAAFSVIEGDQA